MKHYNPENNTVLNFMLHLKLYQPFLLEKYKLLFFSIPKVACTSFYYVFIKIFKPNWNFFYDVRLVHGFIHPTIEIEKIENYNNYVRAGFVRNPFDRLVSMFNSKKDKNFYFINPNSFKETVENVCKNRITDEHVLPQYNFLYRHDKPLFNFIGRFENIEDDFNRLLKLTNLPIKKLPKKNVTNANKLHYRDYYDKRTRKLVEEYYRKDLEVFNYRF